MYLRNSGGWDRRGHKRPTCEELGNRPQLTRVTCYVVGLVLGLSFPLCKMGIKKCPLGCVTVRIKSTERRDSNAHCENSIVSLLVWQLCNNDTIQSLPSLSPGSPCTPLTGPGFHQIHCPTVAGGQPSSYAGQRLGGKKRKAPKFCI